jgi:hypothetical protein
MITRPRQVTCQLTLHFIPLLERPSNGDANGMMINELGMKLNLGRRLPFAD